ncbi:MAG: hypothetical protein JNM51_16700, partial [Bacteroidia bacterium]|nr:hypothetical protein [Bacteroidia bacterium]
MSTFKNSLILLLCFVFTNTFSQTFNWSGFGAGTGAGPRNYTTGNMSAIVTATTGGGQIGYSYGSTTQISGSGFCGGTPNNGLLLEMRGGTSAWTAQINVAITFSTPVCGPVTFSIYDINEAIWSGDNSSYYNDQVVISATDQSATAINPTNINYSGCPAAANTSIVGNTRIITGKITNNTCNCATASITINPGAAQVKTINLLYRNGPPNISKYGVLQFQNIVLSSIVASPPPTAAITSPTLACGITSTILTATTSASSPTYSWTGPGGSTVTSPTASATAVSGAGVYTVVINPGGCSSTATYNIGSGGIPPTVTASASNTLNCTTTTVQAIVSTTSTPVTYNWSGPSVTGGATTASASVNSPGTYNYTVTNTSTGCSTTGTLAIAQNTSVVTASTSATSSLNCTTTTAQIIASTTTTPVSYNWSGTGITGGAGTATININQGGTFNYTITNTSNGCRTTGSQAISQNTVLPSPTASSAGSITCSTSTVALNGGPAALTYTWSGPGFSGGVNTQNVIATATGNYTLAVTGTNGCTNTAVTTVGTNTSLPSPTASSTGSITCSTSTVALNGGPAALTYTWSGPGFSGGTNSQNAVATVAGSYTLTVRGANGCTNTAVTSVTTNTTSPTATALSSVINCTNTISTLTGGPLSGVTYSWSG